MLQYVFPAGQPQNIHRDDDDCDERSGGESDDDGDDGSDLDFDLDGDDDACQNLFGPSHPLCPVHPV